MDEYDCGGKEGLKALLTFAIPEGIPDVLGTQTLVQSPWLSSEPKAEITIQQLLIDGTVHRTTHSHRNPMKYIIMWFPFTLELRLKHYILCGSLVCFLKTRSILFNAEIPLDCFFSSKIAEKCLVDDLPTLKCRYRLWH